MAEVNENKPVLQAKDLRIEFSIDQGKTLKAVNGVNFSVQAGETFGVIGESGSGKTTLGRALVGLLSPSGGKILQNSIDPATLGKKELRKHRQDFQIMFQDPNAALNPRMRIMESIVEPLEIAGQRDHLANRAIALQAMSRVGLLPDLANRYPHQLSGGQKQRVIIARTLTMKPRLIVCDEVVAALDVSIRGEVLNLFSELQQEFGLTYVFITHDLSVVSHISDRIAVMYLGCIMELGPAEILAKRPLHPYTEALLSAEPVALPYHMRKKERIELKGEIPSPVDPPSGCPFRTRCPRATDICAQVRPNWAEHHPGHWVACHHKLE